MTLLRLWARAPRQTGPAGSRWQVLNFREQVAISGFEIVLTSAGAGGRMDRDLKEFRRLERICRAQAELATMKCERAGLLEVAHDCQQAAAKLEGRARWNLGRPVTWSIGVIALILYVTFHLPW